MAAIKVPFSHEWESCSITVDVIYPEEDVTSYWDIGQAAEEVVAVCLNGEEAGGRIHIGIDGAVEIVLYGTHDKVADVMRNVSSDVQSA